MSTESKRLWLALIWALLLVIGAPIFVMASVENWHIAGQVIAKLPIGLWATWTFIMLYDIWMTAKRWSTKEDNAEAERRKAEESSN